MITKPLLADAAELDKVVFPVYTSPKLDGIRCLLKGGKLLSRNFKPIPNNYVRTYLEEHLSGYDGLDGELVLSGNATFQEISSAIMSHDGEPNFVYAVFDHVDERFGLLEPFEDRYRRMLDHAAVLGDKTNGRVSAVSHSIIHSLEQLVEYEEEAVRNGYEGVMLRHPKGKYKCGRSTLKEGILLKVKRFEDSEAKILGFEEKMTNNNEKTTDALGHAKRSSHKANLVGADTLGAIHVVDCKSGVEFSIGSGFNDELRTKIWGNRDQYLGQLVKYKYQPFGVKEETGVPRFPIFLGFRSEADM